MQYRQNAKSKAVTKPTESSLSFKLLAGMALLVALVLMFVFSAQSARAESYGVFPTCDTPTVQKRILDRFNKAEEKQWRRGFTMAQLSRLHEHRTENWKDSEILRRYCMATAHFSNGSHRSVYYLVEENGSIAGLSWDLTYCVSGLDPWRNFDGSCRTVR